MLNIYILSEYSRMKIKEKKNKVKMSNFWPSLKLSGIAIDFT